MPIYMCNAALGLIPGEIKKAIAKDITDAHWDIARTPPASVHVLFFEDTPKHSADCASVLVFGCVHEGYTDHQRDQLAKSVKCALRRNAGLREDDIIAGISVFPGCSVMEHGTLLSEVEAVAFDAN